MSSSSASTSSTSSKRDAKKSQAENDLHEMNELSTRASTTSSDEEKKSSGSDLEKGASSPSDKIVGAFTAQETAEDKPKKLVYVPFVGRKVPRQPYASLDEAPYLPKPGVFSKWTFTWIQPLLILGYQRTLQPLDLWRMPPELEAGHLADQLMLNFNKRRVAVEAWNKALDDGTYQPTVMRKTWWKVRTGVFGIGHADGRNTVGLAGALSDTFFYQFWSAGVIKVFGDISQVTSPLVTKALIDFATNSYYANLGVPGYTMPSVGTGVGLALTLWIMQIISALSTHQFFSRSAGVGVLLRAALISSLYRKSVVLSSKSRVTTTNGTLVVHCSSDISRIDFAAGFFHISWTAVVQFVIIVGLLVANLGPSSLAGIGFLLLATPLQGIAMKKLFALRRRVMVWTDKRVTLLQELLGGQKIIKFFAWEIPYLKKVNDLRHDELKNVRTMLTIRALNSSVAMSIPMLATVIAFIVYASGQPFTNAATIFTSLTLFNLLRMPLMLLPMSLSTITDAHNALGRITKVFLAEEISGTFKVDYDAEAPAILVESADFVWESPPPQVAAKGTQTKAQKAITKAAVKAAIKAKLPAATDANTKSPAGEEAVVEEIKQLSGINLSIPKGALVAIVGPVGSGKSSLLQALIGEMRKTAGDIAFGANGIAYCPQTSWIRNATLRENILFGQEVNEDRYQSVIKNACLTDDLKMLPNGDETEIGEKGINLSGGQKQRVSIARALYYDASIILLDDPLSAVDAHVGEFLFKNAILDFLKNKTRVLVTHGLQYLPDVDYIISMEGGKIVQQGTYTELMADQDGPFAKLVEEFGSRAVEEDKEEKKEELDLPIEAKLPAERVEQKTVALMTVEERQTGTVKGAVYMQYFRAAKGHITLPLLFTALALMQTAQVLGAYWLIFWQEDKFSQSTGFYMGIYALLGISQAIASFLMGLAGVYLGYNASKALFHNAVAGVLRAPMSFFDTTPLGRIMNRFSKDIDTLDNTLNDSMRMAFATFASVLGAIILIAIVNPIFIVFLAGILCLYGLAALFYTKSARELKGMDNLLRSSLYAFFSETLSGLSTIRAYGETQNFIRINERFLDIENRAYLLTIYNQRWLGIRLDFSGSLLVLVVALIGVIARFTISPAQTGLILSYILTIQGAFSWMVRQGAEVQNDLNSVERLLYYSNELEQEAPAIIESKRPAPTWPAQGSIEFDKLVMSYRKGLPSVLKGLSFKVNGGEKIGIVGRTGAGKSSIMMALFRIVDLTSGKIVIDGVDISTIGLKDLRDRISIIPQEALLFNGTIRSNLDPFGEYEDAVLWSALKRAYLVDPSFNPSVPKASTSSGAASPPTQMEGRFTLDLAIEDEGLNLSVGERSLVSLARALVKDSQIIVLDEATSSVDYATDSKIQETIRAEFAHKTLLTIAHRIKTILNYDRIIVLSDGAVAEFDTPINLFREGGIFAQMCITSGITEGDIIATEF